MGAPIKIVVVGSGPNGLVCAIRLADAGFDVTVLEQAAAPGGGVSSAEDTLPGFVHDRCAAFFPLTAASPAFSGLGLERHGLQFIVPPVAMAHPFLDGSSIELHRNLDETVQSLERVSPGAGRAWGELSNLLLAHRRLVVETGLHSFPPVGPGLRLAARLRRESLELARLMIGSTAPSGSSCSAIKLRRHGYRARLRIRISRPGRPVAPPSRSGSPGSVTWSAGPSSGVVPPAHAGAGEQAHECWGLGSVRRGRDGHPRPGEPRIRRSPKRRR